jgi:hypothetical protein
MNTMIDAVPHQEAVTGGQPEEAAGGGRVFFSSVRRSMEYEDEIILVSVGVVHLALGVLTLGARAPGQPLHRL